MSKLYEFIERRKAELGLTTTALMEAGISSSTLHNIRHEKCYSLKEGTMQKLAMVLQCSMGEIQAALAATDQATEFGEMVKKGLPENETAADAITDLPEEDPPAAMRTNGTEPKASSCSMFSIKKAGSRSRLRLTPH